MRVVLAALVALVVAGVVRGTCEDDTEMTFVPVAGQCANGDQAGYYIDDPFAGAVPNGAKFLIWLGDSKLCASEEDCQAFCEGNVNSDCGDVDDNSTEIDCYVNKFYCGSSDWNLAKFAPDTVLCGDVNAPFATYVRVYVPQCSLDWFLGRGGTTGSFTHNGAFILEQVMASLDANRNLGNGDQVVLGGTRGGAVGALNHVKRFQTSFSPEFRVIVDSAWFINKREFGITEYSNGTTTFQFDAELERNSTNWLDASALDADCFSEFNPSNSVYQCLYPSNLLSFGLQLVETFTIQSQFDLEMLLDMGLISGAKESDFLDDVAFSQAVFQFIKGFGTSQRQSLQEVAKEVIPLPATTGFHYFFAPACGQSGFIVPTTLNRINRATESVGDSGSVSFGRDGTEWEKISVLGLTVKEALKQWAVDEVTPQAQDLSLETTVKDKVRADRCGEFLCNPTCPSSIIPFVLEDQTNECQQTTVLLYCVAFLLIMWIPFLLLLARICVWDRSTKNYWKNQRAKDIDAGHADVERQILREAAAGTRGRTVQLMVENLNYWTPGKGRNKGPEQILKNVNLNLQAGSVHAIMGPSGSGKSTLLDVVALTRENGRMTGTHYINGVPSHTQRAGFLREWLRNSISYVRQQDVLFPHLTVREHLVHAAWLMLPQYMSPKKKLRRVWQVLKLLELDHAADTICGDGGVRVEGGISGGQRRRVSVATQLLKMPAALLLDEPTSGLDATNALLLVQCLNNLAHKSGVSVFMTIHQPRREIFVLLDYLTILVKGRVVYSGSPASASEFFGVDPNDVNIGDSILDMLQVAKASAIDNYRSKYENGQLGQQVLQGMEAEKTELTAEKAAALRAILIENALAEGKWSWTETTSMFTAMWVLLSRTIKRGGFDIHKTVLMSLLGGILVGLVFVGNSSYTGHTALAYLAVATMTFLQGTFLGDRYMSEKQMWSHEKDNGTTVSWGAFLVSLFLRNVVSSTIEGLAYSIPVFYMSTLFKDDAEQVINFFMIMIYVAIAVVVQNTTVEIDRIRRGGEGSPDTRQAILINMALLSLSALFNGFIIKLSDIPAYLQWLPYLMLSYWGFVGVLVNNFDGEEFPCEATALECAQRTGDTWIKSFDYDNRDVTQCLFALLLLIILLHIISVLDYYLRFGRSKSSLKRGKPRGVKKADLERENSFGLGGSSPSSPRLGRQDSGNAMDALMDARGDKKKGHGSRGRVFSALLSRENLALFLLFDFFTAWYVCFFNTGENGSGEIGSLANATSDILSQGLNSIEGGNAIFIVLNLMVFLVYVAQFVFQILFLVPLNSEGKRKTIIWLSFHDLLALIFLGVDAVLLLGLFTFAGDNLTIQLVIIFAIRLARAGFVSQYWIKVDSFHHSRAKQTLRLARGQIDDEESEYNASDSARKTGSVQPFISGAPVPPPNTAGNRVSRLFGGITRGPNIAGNRTSGLFSRAPPPPIPVSRHESQQYRQLDLGPQWRAFQQGFQYDDPNEEDEV